MKKQIRKRFRRWMLILTALLLFCTEVQLIPADGIPLRTVQAAPSTLTQAAPSALIQAAPSVPAQKSSEMDYVRVALKNNYGGVSELRIENNTLSFGYCVKNVFYPEEKLISKDGFKIRADSGSYAVYGKSYTSYASAVKAAAQLRTLDRISAVYPASVGKGNWRLYVPKDAVSGSSAGSFRAGTRNSSHMLYVTVGNGGFLIDAEAAARYPQFAPVEENDGKTAVIRLSGGNSYRGRLEAGRYGENGVTAVNVLPLEQYLYGVVPSEMSYAWPMEALKAQAVCARGYALVTAEPGSSGSLAKGYKLTDTTLHQAYKGYGVEQKSTNRAVDATRGETVCFDNRVVRTYYFSTSGGSTEAVEDVWGSNISYLRSVSDIYENNPAKKPWLVSMTKAEIRSRLQARGKKIGNVVDVKPEITTQTGRIYSLKIEGTEGSVTLEKDQVRSVLGLYSTKFKVVKYGEQPDIVSVRGKYDTKQKRINDSWIIGKGGKAKKADAGMEQYVVLSADNRTGFASEAPSSSDKIIFAGTGFGHGVGMSQSGARGMAEAGFTYKEILKHYFTGTKVQ